MEKLRSGSLARVTLSAFLSSRAHCQLLRAHLRRVWEVLVVEVGQDLRGGKERD